MVSGVGKARNRVNGRCVNVSMRTATAVGIPAIVIATAAL